MTIQVELYSFFVVVYCAKRRNQKPGKGYLLVKAAARIGL